MNMLTAEQLAANWKLSPRTIQNMCRNCIYYPDIKDEIGICQCEKRRSEQSAAHTKSHPGGI